MTFCHKTLLENDTLANLTDVENKIPTLLADPQDTQCNKDNLNDAQRYIMVPIGCRRSVLTLPAKSKQEPKRAAR